MGCGASSGRAASAEADLTTDPAPVPQPASVDAESEVETARETPLSSGRRVAHTKPFWEVKEAERTAKAVETAAADPQVDAPPKADAPAKELEAQPFLDVTAASPGETKEEIALPPREAWDVCDVDDDDAKEPPLLRPLAPLPPLALPSGAPLEHLAPHSQAQGPGLKLKPLGVPPLGSRGAALGSIPKAVPGRLAMLDSPTDGAPSSPAPPPAALSNESYASPSGARSPLGEINSNSRVQRFEMSPSLASPDALSRLSGEQPKMRPPKRAPPVTPAGLGASLAPLAALPAPTQSSLPAPPEPPPPTEGPHAKAAPNAKAAPTKPALRAPAAGRQKALSLRWSERLVSAELSYPKDEEKPPLDYKANMAELDRLREHRRLKGQPQLPFREMVVELDMAEGGEALSCLSQGTRKQSTWGQLLSLGHTDSFTTSTVSSSSIASS